MTTFEKGGKTITIIKGGLTGKGRILKKCNCPSCISMSEQYGHSVKDTPCNCHGLITECTCPIRDIKCQRCGRVFVAKDGTWYEVEDMHEKAGAPE